MGNWAHSTTEFPEVKPEWHRGDECVVTLAYKRALLRAAEALTVLDPTQGMQYNT